MEANKKMAHEKMWQQWETRQRRGKLFGGIFIVTIGTLFLARELGVVFPEWVFTWKTLLIGIGVMHFLKHGFSRLGWMIPVAIGGVFLMMDFYPDITVLKPLIWPVSIILFGLFIIFKPRRKHNRLHWEMWQKKRQHWHKYHDEGCSEQTIKTNPDDSIELVTCMSGVKKNVLTKNFKKGSINVILGGAKIDFSQSDINEQATLEVTQVLGGTQLIIPANWQIKSEIVCIMGSVEDKRPTQGNSLQNDTAKILVLEGEIILGGLEIRSHS